MRAASIQSDREPLGLPDPRQPHGRSDPDSRDAGNLNRTVSIEGNDPSEQYTRLALLQLPIKTVVYRGVGPTEQNQVA